MCGGRGSPEVARSAHIQTYKRAGAPCTKLDSKPHGPARAGSGRCRKAHACTRTPGTGSTPNPNLRPHPHHRLSEPQAQGSLLLP